MKLPKLDLSYLNGSTHIDSESEMLVVQGLIAEKGNTKKVAKNFNVSEAIVSRIMVKNYVQINKIVTDNERIDETDKAITDAVDMYADHIEAIKNGRQCKKLPAATVSDLNKMFDRITRIKDSKTKAYDSTLNVMSKNIIKQKTLEVVEKGKSQDSSEYKDNQDSVASKLAEALSKDDDRPQ